MREILPPYFYRRPALEVARALLGMRLVRELDGQRVSGRIIETEAYQGEEDLACHARAGRTARTAVMYGPPGRAYVYFTYGMHWCLNAVTGAEGEPAAVLIRALEPLEGCDLIAARRAPQPRPLWLNGPAKICQAFGIDRRLNGADLTAPQDRLWIEADQPAPEIQIQTSPRIGIQNVPEPWRSIPWRVFLTISETTRRP
ncbi:MAG: DNA-3-methyladenine glycosylase [Anaerolineae bacterium]|nr:DNA-3-methyladenine glycosylase [Anaerolineae bacterium]